jgi:WD40 repeat protein
MNQAQGLVSRVAFSPDGTRIVSGGFDGTVRLWILDGKPAAEPFKGHGGLVLSVAFSPDGTRIVSGGEDGRVRLWTLDGKPAAEPF